LLYIQLKTFTTIHYTNFHIEMSLFLYTSRILYYCYKALLTQNMMMVTTTQHNLILTRTLTGYANMISTNYHAIITNFRSVLNYIERASSRKVTKTQSEGVRFC